MVSTRPLISPSLCTSLLVTIPSAPFTISITVNFIFHSFFSSLARFRDLCLFSLERHYSAGSLFCWLSQSLIVWPRLGDRFVSQNPKELFTSHLFIYHLSVWSHQNFLDNSLWIPFPHQVLSSLIDFFCVNLLYSLMWLLVLFRSQHNPHLVFCCVCLFSVLMALFCAAIRRDSVSLS